MGAVEQGWGDLAQDPIQHLLVAQTQTIPFPCKPPAWIHTAPDVLKRWDTRAGGRDKGTPWMDGQGYSTS